MKQILGLGLLRPRVTREESMAALSEVGPGAAAALLVRHKVAHIARAVALELSAGANRAELLELADEITRLRRPLDESLVSTGRTLRTLRTRLPDAPVFLMKGLATRDWYPPGRPRDVGDADLWVPDADVGWRIVAVLRELGYEYESGELPWIKRDVDGSLFGQMRLLGPEEHAGAFDIHIGPYSVRYCGLVRLTAPPTGSPWQPLGREDTVCGVVGNVAGDCFIDAKTINDIVLALSAPLDVDRVANTLADASLSPFASALLDVVEASCELRQDQRERLRALRRDGEPEDLDLAATPDPEARIRLVTAHAGEAAYRLTGDAARAREIAEDAQRAYQTPKRYRLVRSDPRRAFIPELNPWTCVRLAPQPLLHRLFDRRASVRFPVQRTEALAAGLELLRSRIGDLVRFGDDVFVPTLDYVFPALLVFGRPEV